nr:cytochrome P450 9e2-like [Vanessa tameamea]
MTYMPFGIGPRNCIGSRFALCELKLLLYQILLHNEVSISEKSRFPVKLAPESMNLKIDGGHWLKFKSRNKVLFSCKYHHRRHQSAFLYCWKYASH